MGSIKEPTTRITRIPPKAKMPEMAQVSIRTKKANTHIEPKSCRINFILTRHFTAKYRHERVKPLLIP